MVAVNLQPPGGYGAALAQVPTGAMLPTNTAAPPANAPQQQAQSRSAWKDYLTKAMADPDMRLALLHAGAVMLRPTRRGQSELSKIADGILAGATTYRTAKAGQAAGRAAQQEKMLDRQMAERKQASLEASRAATEKWRRENLELSRQRLAQAQRGRGTGSAQKGLKLELDLLRLTEGLYPYPPEPDTLALPAGEVAGAMEAWQQQVEEVDVQRAAYMEQRRVELGLEEREERVPEPAPEPSPTAAPIARAAPTPTPATPVNLQEMLQRGQVSEDEFVNTATQVYRQLNPNLPAEALGRVRLLAMQQWRQARARGAAAPVERRTTEVYSRQRLPTAFMGLRAAARRGELTMETLQGFKQRVQEELRNKPGDKKLERMLKWAEAEEKRL